MAATRKPLSFAEQRRRKQRAAAIKQQRQAQQPAQAGQVKTIDKPGPPQTSAVVAVAAAVVAAAAAMTTIGMGLPVWGHGWQPGWLLPAGSVTAAAAAVTGRHRTACSTKLQAAVGAVAAMLLAAFIWGAATSIVIDGEVVADTSDIAAAWKLTQKASDDLTTIRNYDELLTIRRAAGTQQIQRIRSSRNSAASDLSAVGGNRPRQTARPSIHRSRPGGGKRRQFQRRRGRWTGQAADRSKQRRLKQRCAATLLSPVNKPWQRNNISALSNNCSVSMLQQQQSCHD